MRLPFSRLPPALTVIRIFCGEIAYKRMIASVIVSCNVIRAVLSCVYSVSVSSTASRARDTDHGRVNQVVARGAKVLFEALQEDLLDWASPGRLTKTSLGLPAACQ